MKIEIILDVENCDRRQLNNVLAKVQEDIFRLTRYSDENEIDDSSTAYGKEYTLYVKIYDNLAKV